MSLSTLFSDVISTAKTAELQALQTPLSTALASIVANPNAVNVALNINSFIASAAAAQGAVETAVLGELATLAKNELQSALSAPASGAAA